MSLLAYIGLEKYRMAKYARKIIEKTVLEIVSKTNASFRFVGKWIHRWVRTMGHGIGLVSK